MQGRNEPTVALAAADGTQNADKLDGVHPIDTRRPAGRSRFRHLDRQLFEQSLADLDRIRRQVAIKPAETYGQPPGFRFASIQAGSIFAELGLRSTDVIVGINGATITTPDQADILFQSIKAGGEVTIQVKGKRRNRIIHLDTISVSRFDSHHFQSLYQKDAGEKLTQFLVYFRSLTTSILNCFGQLAL